MMDLSRHRPYCGLASWVMALDLFWLAGGKAELRLGQGHIFEQGVVILEAVCMSNLETVRLE